MNRPQPQTGLPGQILALVAGAILLVLGFMFSVVLLALVAVVGLALGAWFYWKTRHLRRAMRDAEAMHGAPTQGNVIEGEAIIVEDCRVSETRGLPDDTPRS